MGSTLTQGQLDQLQAAIGWVSRLLQRRLSGHVDADDCLSAAQLGVWQARRALDRRRMGQSGVAAYLRIYGYRRAVDALRAEGSIARPQAENPGKPAAYFTDSLNRPLGPDGPELGETVGRSDPELARLEAREQLERLLRQLGRRERTAVRMYYLEGRTLSEIAWWIPRVKGVGPVSKNWVSQLLARGMEGLRRAMAEQPAG